MKPWSRWQDWTNVVLGLWVFAAPWVLGYSQVAGAAWDDWIVGLVVLLLGIWALAVPASSGVEWTNAVAGLWLFIAGFWLDKGVAAAITNDLVAGALVAVLAAWAALAPPKVEHLAS